jgi:regulator of nucleoside diphosphate kinase
MRHQMPLPEIIISDPEHHELLVLAMAGNGHTAEAADDLLFKLERMRIVPSHNMSPDIVRMGSTVAYRPDNGPEQEVTLVYPARADISLRRISVLTPIGTALLGLRAGQSTTWTARNGRDHVLTVASVHQTEVVA